MLRKRVRKAQEQPNQVPFKHRGLNTRQTIGKNRNQGRKRPHWDFPRFNQAHWRESLSYYMNQCYLMPSPSKSHFTQHPPPSPSPKTALPQGTCPGPFSSCRFPATFLRESGTRRKIPCPDAQWRKLWQTEKQRQNETTSHLTTTQHVWLGQVV